MPPDPPPHWKPLRSERGPDLTLFRVRFDWVENPRNARLMKAVVLETPDWVNIVALTPAGEILTVQQHRLGIGKMTTEIPAGIVEPGETPAQAAARELREETGYTATHWESLGWVEPNPAFQNNRCHFWLARDVVQTHTPQLDEGEHIAVSPLPLAAVKRKIREGRMRNALTLLALSRLFDLRDSWEQTAPQP